MEELTLEQFLKQENPEALAHYRRYLNRHNVPKKGETVVSLVHGFGGLVGVTLEVIGRSTDAEFTTHNYGDDYILLKGYYGDYLATTATWWKEIEVVSA